MNDPLVRFNFKATSEKFKRDEFYLVSGEFLNGLKGIETRLYHNDFRRLTADDTRDMANWLNHKLDSEPIESDN